MYRRDTISTLLTIAVSDVMGAVGIPADIKTASAFGVAASAVTTGIVCSSTGEKEFIIEKMSEDTVASQLDAALSSFYPDAVKIGMLPSVGIATLVAERLKKYGVKNIVVDPIFFQNSEESPSSSHSIEVFETMKESLIPLATLVTPDFEEALAVSGIGRKESQRDFGKTLLETTGAEAVLLTGGGGKADHCTDILFTHDDTRMFRQSRIPSKNTTGAGDVLSTAVACGLAKGFSLPKAVRMAKDFVSFAIQKGHDLALSTGNGPLYLFIK